MTLTDKERIAKVIMTKNKHVIQSLFDHVDNLKTKQIRLRTSQIKQTCSCLV